jgi:Xaa-Pro aminopeptidase
VIISTNPQQYRNGDTHYPFRPHSDFWYLTGFKEPETVAVFSKKHYTIILQEKNPAREIWDGGYCCGLVLIITKAPSSSSLSNFSLLFFGIIFRIIK